MDFRNCPVCGSLFRYVSRYMCPACIEAEEKEFVTVRQYVRDHEGATISAVSEATGISEEKIIRFLKDGRLVSRGLVLEGQLACERCGKPVAEGNMCDTCRADIFRDISRVKGSEREAPPPTPKDLGSRNRMHISEIVKRK
ncbi:MAG: flagellar protein [Firmicutes bacterium]|nr:flagellar protein [Bacillota bacterium]